MPAPDAAWWPLTWRPENDDFYRDAFVVEPAVRVVDYKPADQPQDGPRYHVFVHRGEDPRDNDGADCGWCVAKCETLLEVRATLMRLARLTPPHPDTTGGHDDE